MNPPPVSVAALQACLVQAVRGSEALILRLLQRTAHAMEQADQPGSGLPRRAEIPEALELLARHRAPMLKGYGRALLECFGQSGGAAVWPDRKSTRLNSSHLVISYAVFCLKKKN